MKSKHNVVFSGIEDKSTIVNVDKSIACVVPIDKLPPEYGIPVTLLSELDTNAISIWYVDVVLVIADTGV